VIIPKPILILPPGMPARRSATGSAPWIGLLTLMCGR